MPVLDSIQMSDGRLLVWLSTTDAAEVLGLSGETVRLMCASGEIVARQRVAGAPWRIAASEIRRLLEDGPAPACGLEPLEAA